MKLANSLLRIVVTVAAVVGGWGAVAEITPTGTPAGFGYVPAASYIDTGISPNQNTRIEMRVWVGGPIEYWFGCWDTACNNGSFCMGNDRTGVFTAAGSSAETAAFGDAKTIPVGIHTIAYNSGVFYCDGHVVANRAGSFSLSRNLYLFAQNRAGTGFGKGDIWCQYARIYDGDTLVRD